MNAWDYKEGLPVKIRHEFKLDGENGMERLIIFDDWSSFMANAYSEHCYSPRTFRSITQFEHMWDLCMVHVQYDLRYERVYTKKSDCDPQDWNALMDSLVHDFDESCNRTVTREGEERDVDVYTAEFFDGKAEAELSEEGWTVNYEYEDLNETC